jgi:ribonuclease Z
MDITLTGTGNPIPDPTRAGPSTLVRAGETTLLIDAGRGTLMRLAAAGSGAGALTAVLLTHLHSDHITDLGDLITTRWVTALVPSPLTVIGPPGSQQVVAALLESLRSDIHYRTTHHADLDGPPPVAVREVDPGTILTLHDVRITVGATDHRPVEPTVGFRIEHNGNVVVVAGDTVPCPTLDALAEGADALVITAIRKDILAGIGIGRIEDVIDYHSSVEDAAATAARAGVATLVLTHYVPALTPGTEEEWRALAAAHFDGAVVLGDDLLTVAVG